MLHLLVSIALAVLAGWFAYGLALRKGRNVPAWTIACTLFVLPVVVLAVLPSKRGHDHRPPGSGTPRA